MDDVPLRHPIATWLAAALGTTAVAVVVRAVSALVGVDVLVPDPAGGPPVPLELGPILVVSLGAFAVAAVAVLVADAVLRSRSRRVVKVLGLLVLAGSLATLFTAELPDDGRIVLVLLHVLVGSAVLRTVVRP